MTVRVLLIDDDHRLFELLSRFLGAHDCAVSHAPDGPRGLAQLSQDVFDVVLLDMMMPGMRSIESIQQICTNWPDVPVVVVSVKEDMELIRQALRAGASGYIPKSSSPDVTINAIRLVLSGGIYIPPDALELRGAPERQERDAPGGRALGRPRQGRVELCSGPRGAYGGRRPEDPLHPEVVEEGCDTGVHRPPRGGLGGDREASPLEHVGRHLHADRARRRG